MNGLFAAATEIQDFLDQRGWQSTIIGGLAVIRWGEVRATRDVDVTLLADFGSEEGYIDILLEHFSSRIDDARNFALRNRVLLVTTPSGIDVDISLGGIPYEQRLVARSTTFDFGTGRPLRTCTAEDLVILKAFADRLRDWTDIEGILARSGDQLDTELIIEELAVLAEAKEDPALVHRLEKMFASYRTRVSDPSTADRP